MRHFFTATRIISLLAFAGMAMDTLQAQCTIPAHRARLIAYDSGTGRDTLWFGYDDSATVGVNESLCEMEFPPFPPQGVWEARWINPSGHEGQEPPTGLGQGVKLDYRRMATAATIDTHRVKFQPSEPPGYPVMFKWVRAEVQAICDSCVLVDGFGTVTRMTVQDSLVVNLPSITQLFIIRYGQNLTGVEPGELGIPKRFALEQNYPNPFNPDTRIHFELPHDGPVQLVVYDLLGREVRTLLNEPRVAGRYDAQFDASGLSSGVYLYRLVTPVYVAVKKMVVLK